MKRLNLFIVLIFLCLATNSQISLEHTFSKNVYVSQLDNDVVYYATDTNAVYLYKNDYSLHKEVNIHLPDGYVGFMPFHVTKELFDADGKIEFILVFIPDFDENTTYMSKIYNEDGTIIKDLGEGSFAITVFKDDNTYKLLSLVSLDDETKTKIYSLPGSLPNTGLESTNKLRSENPPYPNPAMDYINIPFNLKPEEISKLKIFNTNGSLIEEKKIEGHMDKIILNVSQYNSGVYFYNYNTDNGKKQKKFIVQ